MKVVLKVIVGELISLFCDDLSLYPWSVKDLGINCRIIVTFDVVSFPWILRAFKWTALLLETHSLNYVFQNHWSSIPLVWLEDSLSYAICGLGFVLP